MPVLFWGKDGNQKYFNSYFARFDGKLMFMFCNPTDSDTDVWTHGDFIMIHPVTGQIFFLGRADGVLNPSGVRFGSAEIYSVIESYFPEVADSLCVGQRRPQDNDETVLLFLMMNAGHEVNQELVAAIKSRIGKELSKRHAPRHIFPTPAIPSTINGKKVELPVKQIVSGHTIKPSSTLANPESLEYYYQFAKLEELERAKL
jgi:acetoacetyl-CoA synthetase